jgi:two-component system response regulator VicR
MVVKLKLKAPLEKEVNSSLNYPIISKMNIMLVEDELSLAQIVKDSLETRDFVVDVFNDGKEAAQNFAQKKYDIFVLDVMLPGMDGFSLATEIRKIDTQTPIIFLTAKSQTDDVVKGFELGGNDYLKKPFSMEELIVRIKSLIGRPVSKNEESDAVNIGHYTFHIKNQTLSYQSEAKQLTHREAEILKLLYEKRNNVLERKPVLQKLWGDDHFFNARSMDVFITKLRKYLKEDESVRILNVRGIGYKLIIP